MFTLLGIVALARKKKTAPLEARSSTHIHPLLSHLTYICLTAEKMCRMRNVLFARVPKNAPPNALKTHTKKRIHILFIMYSRRAPRLSGSVLFSTAGAAGHCFFLLRA